MRPFGGFACVYIYQVGARAADAGALRTEQAHVFCERAREQKAERKKTKLITECAARGGAFALVRLRIAPSFPLGGINRLRE